SHDLWLIGEDTRKPVLQSAERRDPKMLGLATVAHHHLELESGCIRRWICGICQELVQCRARLPYRRHHIRIGCPNPPNFTLVALLLSECERRHQNEQRQQLPQVRLRGLRGLVANKCRFAERHFALRSVILQRIEALAVVESKDTDFPEEQMAPPTS